MCSLPKQFRSQHATETWGFLPQITRDAQREEKALHSIWQPPILTINYVSSLSICLFHGKIFFPFGCFALIHNSQPFFLSEIGQYNHNGEGWAATAKRKSIEISICRKAGRLDFYPFLHFPLCTLSSIHTIWQALIFQHKHFLCFSFFFICWPFCEIANRPLWMHFVCISC